MLKLNHLGRQLGLNPLFLKNGGKTQLGASKLWAYQSRQPGSWNWECVSLSFQLQECRCAWGRLRSQAVVSGHVYMPHDAPLINILEVPMTGADLQSGQWLD